MNINCVLAPPTPTHFCYSMPHLVFLLSIILRKKTSSSFISKYKTEKTIIFCFGGEGPLKGLGMYILCSVHCSSRHHIPLNQI